MKATVTDITPAALPGIYPCRFDAIEEKSNEQGKYWLWTFTFQVPEAKLGNPSDPDVTVNEDGFALIPITSTTSPRITPRTKAAKWIETLRGSAVEVDEEIDFGTMIGLYALGVIELADTGYSRINSLLPANAQPTQATEDVAGNPVEA